MYLQEQVMSNKLNPVISSLIYMVPKKKKYNLSQYNLWLEVCSKEKENVIGSIYIKNKNKKNSMTKIINAEKVP